MNLFFNKADRKVQPDQDEFPWTDSLSKFGFQQKECCQFLPKQDQAEDILVEDVRCCCGEVLGRHSGDHIQGLIPSEYRETFAKRKWKQKAPIIHQSNTDLGQIKLKISPTNACGKVHFSTLCDAKPAKFIRISDETPEENIWNFMKGTWKTMTPKPDLVVSIVGGAKNFRLEGLCRDKFQNGFLKITETSHPMFITSGFNVGIMKDVGQIMKEAQSYSIREKRAVHNIRCLGIAPWGFVRSRQTLEKHSLHVQYAMSKWSRGDYQPIPLNPYHTHFVLVDNGYRNRFTDCGNIAEYRAKLEKRINEESPVVLVVVEGGSGVLDDISHSLSEGIPVVICKGTGRAADLVAYAVSRSDERGNLTHDYVGKIKEELNKLYGSIWSDAAVRETKINDLTKTLCELLTRKDMITVFDIHLDQCMDFYILSALFKGSCGNESKKKNLELAISLNRPDVAELDLFGENDDWPLDNLHSNLEKCIVKDLEGFVRLIIKQENFDMKQFLSLKRLLRIYQESLQENASTVFARLVSRKTNHNENKKELNLDKIDSVINTLLDGLHKNVFKESQDKEMADPYLELFIWAVLSERTILANLFWEYVEAPIATALLGSWLYLEMSKQLSAGEKQAEENLLERKRKMEERAEQTLSDLQTRYPKQAIHCVEQDTPLWGNITPLQIAVVAEAKNFVASTTCQDSLRREWKGDVKMQLWKVLLFLPLALILPGFICVMGKFREPTKNKSCIWKCGTFFCSPRVKFINYIISYTAFLVTFTYMILFQVRDEISPLEFICVSWTISILTDELHRLLCVPALSTRNLIKKWRGFLYMLYLLSIIVVPCALIAHYITGSAEYVRTIYAINCMFFYLRILRFYTASEHLGPKLHIIKSTLRPLFFFGIITMVFLLAYGVPSQALLYEKREPYWGVITDIVYLPYWQIYGELQLENIEDDDTCISNLATRNITDASSCRHYSPVVPVIMAVYLFFANVLLLNLIIAIFTKIFDKVETNSIEIWKYQMYFFIKEYKVKSVLPTPFSFLEDLLRILSHTVYYCCGTCGGKRTGLSKDDERHLRWVERQITDRLLRRMKEMEVSSIENYLLTIHRSINNLHSALIADLGVLGKTSNAGVHDTKSSTMNSLDVNRMTDRIGSLLNSYPRLDGQAWSAVSSRSVDVTIRKNTAQAMGMWSH